jgi:hypothetical protein
MGTRSRQHLFYAAAVAVALGLGLWLFWPTLQLGLFADDYTAAAMMDGTFASARGPLDLFNFADGTPQDVAALRRLGSIPWWAPADFRVSFLRPLSSALWHLDRTLFGNALWAYHAHSIAAWAMLVVATSLLYRRLLPTGVAALATLMFAVDDSHHFPVIWLSNRGGIYAVLIGVLGLLSHLRWRIDGRRAYAPISAGLLSVGLLFGEWALPMFAYILAFEALGTREPLTRRALALLPSALPGAVFLIGRAWLGYGARGSGAYVDPGAEPLRFAIAVLQRIPVFMADMIWNVPSSWWDQGTPWRDRILDLGLIAPPLWARLPGWPQFHLGLGMLGFAVFGLALRFTWHGLSASERVHVRWLLLGALLALVPVVGSFPSTRLTLVAFLGMAPVLALVVRQIGRRLWSAPSIGLVRWFSFYAAGLLILWFQLLAPLRDNIEAQVDDFAATTKWVLAAQLDPKRVAQQRVFVLAGGEFTTTFFFAYIWANHGRPLPRSYYPISTAPFAQDIERVTDNGLRLRALGSSYLGSGHEDMFCSAKRRWHEGESVDLAGMRVTAEDTGDGLPFSLRLTFDRSLDDPSYAFLVATSRGLERFAVPAVGQTTRVPRAGYPSWLALAHNREQHRIAPIPEALSFASPPGFVLYKP